MKPSLFLCLLLWSEAVSSLPQYGGGGVRPSVQVQPQVQASNCQTTYETVTQVVYEEVTENICKDTTREQCDWVQTQQCSPQRKQKCQSINKRKCDSGTKEQCNNVWKEVNEPYQDQECWNEPSQPCEKIWVTSGYGQKDWVDDPNCNNQSQRKCRQVTRYRQQKIQEKQCQQVPWENCYNAPVQECGWVTQQQCQNVPQKQCYQVPHKECENVHKKVPRVQSQRVPKSSCGNNNDDWDQGYNVRELSPRPRTRSGVDPGLANDGPIKFTE